MKNLKQVIGAKVVSEEGAGSRNKTEAAEKEVVIFEERWGNIDNGDCDQRGSSGLGIRKTTEDERLSGFENKRKANDNRGTAVGGQDAVLLDEGVKG